MGIELEIFDILTQKKYRKDRPYKKDKILETISKFTLDSTPIKVVGYWGIGHKKSPNWAEDATCNFLLELRDKITNVYPPGINFTFILPIPYGYLNRIPENKILSYAYSMRQLFKSIQFECIELLPLWNKYNISLNEIEDILEQKSENWWMDIKNNKKMEYNAKKINYLETPEIAAQKIFILRQCEKRMLENEFSCSIFMCFYDSGKRNILPDIPTLYFYTRKGWSNAPWFVYT